MSKGAIMSQAITEEITQDIARAIVLIMVVGVMLYLAATGQSIPEGLTGLTMLVVGYFFGTTQTRYKTIKSNGVTNGKSV